jgi:hypothetical protein
MRRPKESVDRLRVFGMPLQPEQKFIHPLQMPSGVVQEDWQVLVEIHRRDPLSRGRGGQDCHRQTIEEGLRIEDHHGEAFQVDDPMAEAPG